MTDLKDGESTTMKGSAKAPYTLKNTGGVYSCTCPAWRNQSRGIEARTCKHLRKLRGDAAEQARIGAPQALPKVPVATNSAKAPPLLLGHPWDNSQDLAGWWMSEKLDGVRAYWDGQQLISRYGNTYLAPDWFLAGFPKEPLDGELWIGRGEFQKTVSVVRRKDKSKHWKEVRYQVFDAPARKKSPFEDRLDFLEGALPRDHDFLVNLDHALCRDLQHLRAELKRVEALGGEGLMMRRPQSLYEAGKSHSLLKVKTFFDAEAIVTGHLPGKGKHKGRLGALQVKLADGTEFSVGTGLSDADRAAPPKLGAVITFRYQELTKAGVPRFPSFLRLRTDVDFKLDTKTKKKTGAAKKSAAKQAAAKSPAPSAMPAGARRFELSDGAAHKFWEVAVVGAEVTVRYGRIGTDGRLQTKPLKDAAAAKAHADGLIAKKTGKGYNEVKAANPS